MYANWSPPTWLTTIDFARERDDPALRVTRPSRGTPRRSYARCLARDRMGRREGRWVGADPCAEPEVESRPSWQGSYSAASHGEW
jgi:hypothetical protein